jgi:hypothetical protein
MSLTGRRRWGTLPSPPTVSVSPASLGAAGETRRRPTVGEHRLGAEIRFRRWPTLLPVRPEAIAYVRP